MFVDESEAEIKAEKLRELRRRLHAGSARLCCNTPAGLAPMVGERRGRGAGHPAQNHRGCQLHYVGAWNEKTSWRTLVPPPPVCVCVDTGRSGEPRPHHWLHPLTLPTGVKAPRGRSLPSQSQVDKQRCSDESTSALAWVLSTDSGWSGGGGGGEGRKGGTRGKGGGSHVASQ